MILAPAPRSVERREGVFEFGAMDRRIVIDAPEAAQLLFTAQDLQRRIAEHTGGTWGIAASAAGPASEVGVVLRIRSDATEHDQGYRLEVTPERILIEGRTPQGVFYGTTTLGQLLVQHPDDASTESNHKNLPALVIEDHPDFDVRGVMLDVSRDKVPTLKTTFDLIDKLASWKINQVQLYTEHTFAYRDHREVWAEASPFTGEEILELDAYCKAYFIELVPNQNTFGHMHRWLKHERYAHLAEVTGAPSTESKNQSFPLPWGGTREGPFSLSPAEPGSLALVGELFDELLPHFSSRQINVGCDETFDLGYGRTKETAEKEGIGRVYLDFLLAIYREVTARGHTMMFWGDIIEKYPELIPELPKDVVALGWDYEASAKFSETCPKYAEAGVPFYVVPGTSSWCSIAGRTDNALVNLRNAAENGRANGAIGYLTTDWGDLGHWQPLPVSYLGLLAGASYSWSLDTAASVDFAAAVSLHAFEDPTGHLGRLAYDLGNVYAKITLELHNSSALFWLLQVALADLRNGEMPRPWLPKFDLDPADLHAALEAIDAAMAHLPEARSASPDAALIADEFTNAARMLRHGALRGLAMLGETIDPVEMRADLEAIIEAYKANWLARNRPGGLPDSLGKLEALRADYAG